MGWAVVSFVHIDIIDKPTLIDEDVKKVKDRLKKEVLQGDVSDLSVDLDSIYFELWGNKGVDYAIVDTLKGMLKALKYRFEISAHEYIESCDGGYYYSTEK